MLSRKLRPRLCQACRDDLLALFENGFASYCTYNIHRQRSAWRAWSALPRPLYRGKGIRPSSSKHASSHSNDAPKPPSDAASTDAQVVSQIYRAQLEAITQQRSMPQVGGLDEFGLEYTTERLDEIVHHRWEAENAVVFESPEAITEATQGTRQVMERYEQDDEALGKGIDESFRDSSETPALLQGEGIAESPMQGEGEPLTDRPNPVQALRDLNASVDEVVREARQIHGEYLPEGVLSEDESKTYHRLYGAPLERVPEGKETHLDEERALHELLNQEGETVAYDRKGSEGDVNEEDIPPNSDRNQMNLTESYNQRAMEVAEQIGGEFRPYEDNAATEEEAVERGHPLTLAGRFSTSPRTIYLPQESFVQPIQKMLSEYSNNHIKEMCERVFGGPGLPNSPLTPRIGRTLPQMSIPLDASQHGMGTMEANAYVSAIWPSTYAAITSVLVETRKRLGSQWLRELLTKEGAASVLDAGGGGVGILAWRDIIAAEWEALHSSDASPPPTPLGKSTVLTGADSLRHRAASLLGNTTFLPRLPDYVHLRDRATLSDDRPAAQRKQFDVIIAPHTLWSLGEEWQRKHQVQNLWSLLNPDSGVLILIEKGVPRGFEVIAGARELLLSKYIATADSPNYQSKLESSDEVRLVQKGKGVIIAPCTNHVPCPMYPVPGVSRGRKDYCYFQQRYIRPPFLQRILGAKDRNNDDVDFSFIAVQKGRDLQDTSITNEPVTQGKDATDSAFEGYEDATDPAETAQVNALTLPRLILPPLKRPGHVTVDLCTPAGKIDRWIISKSFSKTAYRDARKASWGDLWALGAKTRVPRNLQLGGEKSKRGKSQKERLMNKARSMVEEMKEEKRAEREMEAELERSIDAESEAILEAEDDDFDADAAEILKEIEQEREQKKVEAGSQRAKSRQRRAPSANPPQQEDAPKPQLQPFHQSATNHMPNDSGTHSSGEDASSSETPESLSPSDLAALADYAAESRVDQVNSQSLSRLSGHSPKIRMRRGENKFEEPEKEKWRAGIERRKAEGRADKKKGRNLSRSNRDRRRSK
ncbi:hypothetical protein GJ744_001844 [Endocarpon pusillum]|uniref:37S ribosomal protein Rsm22 n=1 Tax=Endocarpon pusillum TaxID=364733 RepID=A0A8H7EA21_9EURO|nr:hypothetical protein GJ744_001844 [Endocarpon pusillum]